MLFLKLQFKIAPLTLKMMVIQGTNSIFLTQRIIDILNPDDYKEQEKAAVREFRKKLSAYVRKLPKLTKEEIIEQIDAIPRKEVIGKDLHEYLYKNYRQLFFPKGVSWYEFNPLEYFLDTKNLKLDFTRKNGEIGSVTIMENKRSFEMRKSLKESRGEISFSGGFLANMVYVGDLCYCLNDAVYQDAIELADPEGKFDSIASGMHVEGAFVSTDHGDGDYEGSDGRNYSVDAGIIGIVNITNASATEGEDFQSFSKLGRVIKLPKYGPTQYEISRDSAGVITVDVKQGKFTETIAIPTGFAEEYTCNECGEEISEWEYRRYGGCCESCYRESMYGSDGEEEEDLYECCDAGCTSAEFQRMASGKNAKMIGMKKRPLGKKGKYNTLGEKRTSRPNSKNELLEKDVKAAVLKTFQEFFEGNDKVVLPKKLTSTDTSLPVLINGKKSLKVAIKVLVNEEIGTYVLDGLTNKDKNLLPDSYFQGTSLEEAERDALAFAKDVNKLVKESLKESKRKEMDW